MLWDWQQLVHPCLVVLHYMVTKGPIQWMLQVARSVEYVQSGTVALQDAKMLQKKTRKWMCCAIILLLVTAAVIVIVVSKHHALALGSAE